MSMMRSTFMTKTFYLWRPYNRATHLLAAKFGPSRPSQGHTNPAVKGSCPNNPAPVVGTIR